MNIGLVTVIIRLGHNGIPAKFFHISRLNWLKFSARDLPLNNAIMLQGVLKTVQWKPYIF